MDPHLQCDIAVREGWGVDARRVHRSRFGSRMGRDWCVTSTKKRPSVAQPANRHQEQCFYSLELWGGFRISTDSAVSFLSHIFKHTMQIGRQIHVRLFEYTRADGDDNAISEIYPVLVHGE